LANHYTIHLTAT